MSPSSESHWILPLKSVAVVSAVFGFTCLGVLVVVTALDNKDALSTVALALAILAFTVQLIVFVAQQGLASEQGRRNEELYGSMQGVLAEIREKAAGTQADVRTISDRMLGAIMSKNIADTPGGKIDPGRLVSEIGAVMEGDDAQQIAEVGRQIWPERRPSPDDAVLVELLQSYPAEAEVGDAMDMLVKLAPGDREALKTFGSDEIMARQPGSPFDPSLTHLAGPGLADAGLIEPYPADRQKVPGLTVMHLTDRGRKVARLLTALGDPPPYLPDLKKIRDETPDRFSGT
jgi:hypothetical protein